MPAPPGPSSMEIPIIDISGYTVADAPKTSEIISALRIACVNPGFFQITGHSVPASLRTETFQKLHDFFALPVETKKSVHRNQSASLRGYELVGEQKLDSSMGSDQKEGFMIGPELPPGRFLQGPNRWLDEGVCPGFRETFMRYFGEAWELSKVVFRLLALSLGLEEGYFDEFVGRKDSISMCRAHRYPPTTEAMATKSRGIGAHTDFGALTLLLQDDVGGLEVYHEPDDTWYPVAYIPDAYVVNIGDMMERWTNNRYKSTRHRVISPVSGRDRYSIAFFNEGLLDQVLTCIPTCVEEGERPLHEPITVERHLRNRYGGSY
ncbi:isopenicillin N synthase family dioxygenase [Aspergillus undulatus]|uniref:isopenicillin N synthase family dioxygenase n=1 Tax=Aspergillus undulatus TaxID=1810928 RepID=UPI003CCE4264